MLRQEEKSYPNPCGWGRPTELVGALQCRGRIIRVSLCHTWCWLLYTRRGKDPSWGAPEGSPEEGGLGTVPGSQCRGNPPEPEGIKRPTRRRPLSARSPRSSGPMRAPGRRYSAPRASPPRPRKRERACAARADAGRRLGAGAHAPHLPPPPRVRLHLVLRRRAVRLGRPARPLRDFRRRLFFFF